MGGTIWEPTEIEAWTGKLAVPGNGDKCLMINKIGFEGQVDVA